MRVMNTKDRLYALPPCTHDLVHPVIESFFDVVDSLVSVFPDLGTDVVMHLPLQTVIFILCHAFTHPSCNHPSNPSSSISDLTLPVS